MLKYVRKGKSVVKALESHVVSFVVVHEVVDVLADPMPSNTLRILHLLGEGQDLHTIVVQRVRFHQVDHIELYL